MAVTETEFEQYACMIDEMQTAKDSAAEGDINRAMISAEKSRMLYRRLEQSGAIKTIRKEAFIVDKVSEEFIEVITAQAYLAASEAALKEGNVKKAQLSHWMILPGTELRQYLDSENNGLAKRARTMDHLLCIVNRKYLN